MQGEGADSRTGLSDIVDDIKMVIFYPLDAEVRDLCGVAVLLEIVRQGKDAHGEVIDPDKIAEGLIPIIKLGSMYEQAIKPFLIHLFPSDLPGFSPHLV
jgi:hypothetical protein